MTTALQTVDRFMTDGFGLDKDGGLFVGLAPILPPTFTYGASLPKPAESR